MLFDVVRRRLPAGGDWSASGLPSFITVLVVCGIGTLAFQAYYDFRVTGHVCSSLTRFTSSNTTISRVFWFENPTTPTLETNPVVRKFHQQWEVEAYEERRDLLTGKQSLVLASEKALDSSRVKGTAKGDGAHRGDGSDPGSFIPLPDRQQRQKSLVSSSRVHSSALAGIIYVCALRNRRNYHIDRSSLSPHLAVHGTRLANILDRNSFCDIPD